MMALLHLQLLLALASTFATRAVLALDTSTPTPTPTITQSLASSSTSTAHNCKYGLFSAPVSFLNLDELQYTLAAYDGSFFTVEANCASSLSATPCSLDSPALITYGPDFQHLHAAVVYTSTPHPQPGSFTPMVGTWFINQDCQLLSGGSATCTNYGLYTDGEIAMRTESTVKQTQAPPQTTGQLKVTVPTFAPEERFALCTSDFMIVDRLTMDGRAAVARPTGLAGAVAGAGAVAIAAAAAFL